MRLEHVEDPDEELREAVYVQLRTHNQDSSPVHWAARELPGNAPQPVGVFAFDDAGEVLGGLFGSTEFSWLKVDLMAVDQGRRGEGIGTALLAEAEGIGRRRGCKYAFTDTMDYQAPGFYQKAGYEVVGTIDDWDSHGHTKFFFRKHL